MDQVALVIGFGIVMLVYERQRPAWPFLAVRGWWLRAMSLTVVQAATAWLASATWDLWLSGAALWRVGGYGLAADALIGYFALTFVYYWWHRARHEVPLLWRWLHQVHHSPARLELFTAFYKHPLEILLNGVLSSTILHVGLGLSAESASLTVVITGIAELAYHWNVRSPYWIGFLFQRPESHRVHHERGRHTGNFSDLPLWDMLFGTFENPRVAPRDCGFAGDAECELVALLAGKRVARPQPAHQRIKDTA